MNTPFWRLNSVGVLFAAIGLVIVAQIVRIQTGPQAQVLRELGSLYEGTERTIQPVRGQIYDRWGNLLAGNTTTYQIGVDLNQVRNPETIALALSVVVGADYDEVLAAASVAPSRTAVYAVLADFISAEKVEQLQQMVEQIEAEARPLGKGELAPSLRGLVFEPHLHRSYPEKDLASGVLGFVSREGKGYFGVEEKYNDLLAGVAKTVYVPNDPNQVNTQELAPEGASLILTIDREIQASVEQILDAAVLANGAESGTIVVVQPETGEILAMASTPRLDLNNYWDYSQFFPNTTPFNRAASQAYEPGSVFKVLTMAAALDSQTVKPDTSFLDTGVFQIGGIYIHNWNLGAWGPQTMLGCMQHSLNVCLAWVASEMGTSTFYGYLQRFGIGHPTGVDLAGEVAGRLKIPGDSDWFEADLGTNSFGQGVSATPIQMVMAISSLANDGVMVNPHVLRAVIDKGHQFDIPTQEVGRPISAETAHTITQMLSVSLEEESSAALVPGYRVAGKTGTAEVPTPLGYTGNQTNASFVGWGPVDDPKFLVYVWLEKPSSSPWGSVVAAPVFSQVAQRLVVLMDIPPDDIREELASH
jgi:cell division protein FtsI/penicillin-binding protein 2